MRETGIFTGTTSSLCLSLRQLPDRSAIRAGRNLPDKEFRSDIVTPTYVEGLVISANLCMSPCSTDYIFILFAEDAWRVVSEDSSLRWPFLLIICTFAFSRGDPFNPWLKQTTDHTDESRIYQLLLRSSRYSDFPAYSQISLRLH